MKSLLLWMGTGQGRIVAALALYAVVWGLERAPVVRGWLDGRPTLKRAAAVALTVLPAAAAGLWAGLPLADVWQTAVTAFLAATGLNAVVPKFAAGKVTPDALRSTGALFVACAVAGAFCATLAFAALLPGCQLPPDRAAKVAACKAGVEQCLTDAKLMAGTKDEQMAAYERCRDRVHVACLGPEPSASASTSATPSAAPSAAASVAP